MQANFGQHKRFSGWGEDGTEEEEGGRRGRKESPDAEVLPDTSPQSPSWACPIWAVAAHSDLCFLNSKHKSNWAACSFPGSKGEFVSLLGAKLLLLLPNLDRMQCRPASLTHVGIGL